MFWTQIVLLVSYSRGGGQTATPVLQDGAAKRREASGRTLRLPQASPVEALSLASALHLSGTRPKLLNLTHLIRVCLVLEDLMLESMLSK